VVIDPLSGDSLSSEELMTRLEGIANRPLGRDPQSLSLGQFLQEAAPREIIARMLRNLKEIHHSQSDWQRLVAVQDRLVSLLPQAWDEYRDRGLGQAELGQSHAAVDDLQTYLDRVQTSADRQYIMDRLVNLQRALG
jgi:regulator of sirC expression with transglutaminase-like and TPR domain